MKHQRYLRTTEKDKLKPILLERDGSKCLYCKNELHTPHDFHSKELRLTIDHLDDNPHNNDRCNLALCHWKCNQDKKRNIDYKLIAKAKIDELSRTFDSMGVCVSQKAEPKQTTKEMDVNLAFFRITKDFISERLLLQNKPAIEYNDTAYAVAYLMKTQTDHGSSATAKRYINEMCSSVAPFKLEEQNGTWYIVKRT